MADKVFDVKISGLAEYRRAMREAPKQVRKLVRKGLRKGAALITKAAKARAPVLSSPARFRKPGTVRAAIAARASKFARRAGDEGVFVGVRPLRGARARKFGKAGATNPNDPYYWWFLEFGTRKMRRRSFLDPAAREQGAAAVDALVSEVDKGIADMDKRGVS